MAASQQHDGEEMGSTHEHGAPSLMVKRRIREAAQECSDLAATRARDPAAHGQLVPQIKAVAAARDHARTQHGAAKAVALVDVRAAYLSMGASCILLAERADRPQEPPRGQRLAEKRSRFPDVYWDAGPKRWRARVWIPQEQTSRHLGHYDTEEEAADAALSFRRQMGRRLKAAARAA